MIKHSEILEEYDKNYIRQRCLSYSKRLKIYEDLLKEALYLKKLPLKNSLEGIDSCLRVARILNLSKDD